MVGSQPDAQPEFRFAGTRPMNTLGSLSKAWPLNYLEWSPFSLAHLQASVEENPLTQAILRTERLVDSTLWTKKPVAPTAPYPVPPSPEVEFSHLDTRNRNCALATFIKRLSCTILQLSSARQAGSLQPQHTLKQPGGISASCKLWQRVRPEGRVPKVRPLSL